MPDEGLGFVVPLLDPGSDGSDELSGGVMCSTLQPLLSELREPAFDEVEQLE